MSVVRWGACDRSTGPALHRQREIISFGCCRTGLGDRGYGIRPRHGTRHGFAHINGCFVRPCPGTQASKPVVWGCDERPTSLAPGLIPRPSRLLSGGGMWSQPRRHRLKSGPPRPYGVGVSPYSRARPRKGDPASRQGKPWKGQVGRAGAAMPRERCHAVRLRGHTMFRSYSAGMPRREWRSEASAPGSCGWSWSSASGSTPARAATCCTSADEPCVGHERRSASTRRSSPTLR